MAPSWTAAPSPSTSLGHAKNVRAEAVVVVANLAGAVAVAAGAAIATKSRNVVRPGSGKTGLAFFIGAAPQPVCGNSQPSVDPARSSFGIPQGIKQPWLWSEQFGTRE